MSYVCCIYDSNWWIGHVLETDSNENDLRINFLHPYESSKYFYWPSRADICWIPSSRVFRKISPPKLTLAAAAIQSATL